MNKTGYVRQKTYAGGTRTIVMSRNWDRVWQSPYSNNATNRNRIVRTSPVKLFPSGVLFHAFIRVAAGSIDSSSRASAQREKRGGVAVGRPSILARCTR
jgi:hypothetical protein